jgi:hypothetical protein
MGNTAAKALLSAKQVAVFKPKSKQRSKKGKAEAVGKQLPEFIKTNLSKEYEPRVNSVPMKFEKVTSILNLIKVDTSFRLVPGFYAIRTSDLDSMIENGFQQPETFYYDDITTMINIMGDSSYIILMCYFRTSDKNTKIDRDHKTIRMKNPQDISIFGYIKVEPKYTFTIYMYEEKYEEKSDDTMIGSWEN